jgi:hypothetical protein
MTARVAMARLRHNRWAFRALVAVLIAVCALTWTSALKASQAHAGKRYDVPHSSAMEAKLGIRVVQAAVVADGGLVELRYTVLDTGRATTFQNDVHHPPVLRGSKHQGTPLYRTALMKQGHDLRPGQTYYILYMNNRGAVHPGDTLEIDAAGVTLANVPVR